MAEVAVPISSLDNSAPDIAFLVQNTYRDIIVKNVRCGDLLPHMCIPESNQKLCDDVLALENSQKQREACGLFLDYLNGRAEQKDYLLFLQLLEQGGYIYVAKLLRGDDTLDPDIHREHCRLIQFFSQDIASSIDPDYMYPKLIEDDWMDAEDGQHLKSISRNGGRIQAARWLVLVILPRRKENWFKQFLQLLWDYGHKELVGDIHEDFKIKCLKSPEEVIEENDTGIEESMDEDDTVGVNVLTASGEAYNSLNLMDPVPTHMLNYAENTDYLKPVREKTSLFETDPDRLENWITTPFNTILSTASSRDVPDDMSIDSSQEDNTRYEIDIEVDDLITPEMLAARDKVIRPLENRPYQEELSCAAAGGSNVIIIAPTGCGKTVVALMIMQDHISRLERDGKPSKIAFFANEVTLVEQQHDLCRHHLASKINTMMVVGETKYKTRETLPEMIENNGLLVMTPQIIVDALESKTLTSLSVFTLIIFDECHHVRDKHPTNQIMCHYMEIKQHQDSVILPQIVGLTASVGVGKRKEMAEKEGAVDHIMTLCANLDAKGGLITVRENKESLAVYANFVETAIKKANQRQTDPFKTCIVTQIMERIEERMINKYMQSKPLLKHIKNLEKEVKPCQEKGTSWYTQWLGKLYSDKFLRIKKNALLRRFFLTCVGCLSIYNKALSINEDCRTIDAMNYLEDKIKSLYPARAYRTDTDEWLYSLYTENQKSLKNECKSGVNINPKLVLLQCLILDQIKKKKDSRIIVLVRTRDLAHALVKWMEVEDILTKLSPVVVTGCGASADEGGMTRAQQIDAVRSFKWGNSRVAVATSVAEEGMDVAKCSRVIRYEFVSNEIGMIQARGRASRVEDGTYFTVTSKEDVAMKENSNIRLEGVMNETIEHLQQQFDNDFSSFCQTLEEIQKREKTSREQEKIKQQAQPTTDEKYELRCYNCDVFALHSTDIRMVANSHRLVLSKDIWSRVSEQEPEKKEAFDSMQKVSSVHCKNCQVRWGSGVMYKEAKFVCISIVNFMAYDPREKSFHWPKWKRVHFKCQKMSSEDISQFTTPGP